MVGHEYLGSEEPSPGHWRHFLRRKNTETAAEMATDMSQARSYTWRLRARSTGMREATLYARNFSWQLGQPASFEEKDAHPSAIEAALGALAADVLNGFASICAQKDCPLDELEVNTKATLHDVMAHLGLSTGDPSMASVDLTLFVTAAAPGATIRAIWEEAKRRSPLYNTFKKALALDSRLVLM